MRLLALVYASLALLLGISVAGCTDKPASLRDPLASERVAPSGNVREFDLWVQGDYDHAIAGSATHGWTYRYARSEDDPGTIPAEEIRVRQGDTVRVRLHTTTEHTIHWHGVLLPWGMDGVPDMTQGVGTGTFTYEFVANEAGTFWYHCHVDAPEHIDLGMFGALIVEPADPSDDPPFDRETTLFLHEYDLDGYALSDLVFRASEGDLAALDSLGSLPSNPADLAAYLLENAGTTSSDLTEFGPGYVGLPGAKTRGYLPTYDTFMINGKSYPYTDHVHIDEGETLRVRLINAGQLTHTMHLHGHRFLVTHKDGALLPAPYLADTLGLFPGERYDIYVRGNNPGHWDFHDHGGAMGVGGFAANLGMFPGGMTTALVYDGWTAPPLESPS